jgi:hypothetical protein
MKKSLLFCFLFSCLTMGASAQESPTAQAGGWRWQVQSGVQLLGRRLTSLDADGTRAKFWTNERYYLGVSGWHDLHRHWALGMGMSYSFHHLRYDFYPFWTSDVFHEGERSLRIGVTLAPAVRWQQSAERGLFAQTASTVRIAVGHLGDYRDVYWIVDVSRSIFPNGVLYEHRFTFGQEMSVGYLLPLARKGAISLRASALWELRHKHGIDRVGYPERPWAIQPGLELGWRWAK